MISESVAAAPSDHQTEAWRGTRSIAPTSCLPRVYQSTGSAVTSGRSRVGPAARQAPRRAPRQAPRRAPSEAPESTGPVSG